MTPAITENAYNILLSAKRMATREGAASPSLSIKVHAALETGDVPRTLYAENPTLADLLDIVLEMQEILSGKA